MRFRKSDWAPNEHDVRLTQIEARISLLLAQFQPNKEIGALLHITEGTVAQHVSDLLRGLRLRNRGELQQWVYQHPEALVGGQSGDVSIGPLKIDHMRVLQAAGLNDAQIAARLQISEAAVAQHIRELLLLLHVLSREELLRWSRENPGALEQGWTHTDMHPMGCDCGKPYCLLASL